MADWRYGVAAEQSREDRFMPDPSDDPDYQAFVASMLKFCRCDFDRPCDGVLMGAPCDQRRERLDEYDYDGDD